MTMRGVWLGVLSVVLFGAAMPASKVLLADLQPFQLAGLLYLGAALAVLPMALPQQLLRATLGLHRQNRIRLLGAVVFGGIVAPVLILCALQRAPAGEVSLLLNLEIAATAALGFFFFHEHLHARESTSIAGIILGAALLSSQGTRPDSLAGLAALSACLCWGLDNNLTALIDGLTPAGVTLWKGLAAGIVNLVLGLALEPFSASPGAIGRALLLGGISYGASLACYISAAQQLGATRAQTLFASAPFIGAGLAALFLGERIGAREAIAAAIFGASVFALLRARHEHWHEHEAIEHVHSHRHDDGHHFHGHEGLDASVRHTHRHEHEAFEHAGSHWPDLHHRHKH